MGKRGERKRGREEEKEGGREREERAVGRGRDGSFPILLYKHLFIWIRYLAP